MAIELAYINTKHPDFHKEAALVSSLLKNAEEDEYTRLGIMAPQNRPNKRHTVAITYPNANIPNDIEDRKVHIY